MNIAKIKRDLLTTGEATTGTLDIFMDSDRTAEICKDGDYLFTVDNWAELEAFLMDIQ